MAARASVILAVETLTGVRIPRTPGTSEDINMRKHTRTKPAGIMGSPTVPNQGKSLQTKSIMAIREILNSKRLNISIFIIFHILLTVSQYPMFF